MISASLCLSKMASVYCSGAVVVQVVLAAKTALPYLAVKPRKKLVKYHCLHMIVVISRNFLPH